jgi:hypothetical protein
LESENKYGFIIMDGNGSLFGTLSGNTREVSGSSRFACLFSLALVITCRPFSHA